ncbi:uncharacterized protein LOC135199727 [Macrobrachium nipponense]|uniref:uncharacterized protein LOC135199727 n=1 Tax=Macrobrachium nipponense TaxID=159736 RepID=UPI0030C8C74A
MKILIVLAALGVCSAFHHYNKYDTNNNYYSSSPYYGSSYRGNNYYRTSLRGLNGRFIGATTPAPAYNYVSTPASAYNYVSTPASAYNYVSTPASAYNYVSTPASAYNYATTLAPTYNYATTPASAYNYASTLAPTYNYATTATSAFRPSTYLGSSPSSLGHYSVSSSTPGYFQPPSYSTSGSYVTPSPLGLYGSSLLSRNPYQLGTTSYGNGYSVTPAVLTHHSAQSIYPQNTVTYNPYNVLASSPYSRVNSYSHSVPSNIVVSNGYVQDTPEVAAAKAEFFRSYNSVAAASGNHRYYNYACAFQLHDIFWETVPQSNGVRNKAPLELRNKERLELRNKGPLDQFDDSNAMKTLVVLAVMGLCSALPRQAHDSSSSSSDRRFSRQSYDGDLDQPAGAKGRINSVADPYDMAPALSNFLDAYKRQLAVLSHATSYDPSPDYGQETTTYDVVQQASHNPVSSPARTIAHGHPFSADSLPQSQAYNAPDGLPINIHARAIENYAPPAHHLIPKTHAAPVHPSARRAPAHTTFQGPVQFKAPTQASFHGPAGGAFPGYSGPAPTSYEQAGSAPDDAYNFVTPSRIVVHNGYVQDTPEVAAAKEEFYSIFNLQAAAAAAAPDDYDYYESNDYGVTKGKSKNAARYY